VNKEQIISSGLLEAYVVGSNTPIENAQVEQFRLQYPEVNNEILEIEQTLEAYAFANAITPSYDVKKKITMALQMPINSATQNNTTKVVTLSPWRNIAAASIALLIGSAIFNVVYFSKYKDANTKYEESEKAISTLNSNLSESSNDMNVIRSKYSLPLKLKPDIAPKDADAKIYWLTNTGEIYIDPSNLPAAPKGKQYQLWAIVDGKAIDAGLIVSKDGTLKMQKMKTFGKAQAFAVTLEVEGGVVASKEKPYVIVSL
jgi:anti-sigma-K factor RskA